MKATTTIAGYINENNQKNLGCSGESGTDHMQSFYLMKCLSCGNEIRPTDQIFGKENAQDAKVGNLRCSFLLCL